MKYLFFLLVLVNIVFYLWETGVGRPPARQAPPSSEASIVLLKELPEKPGDTPPSKANGPVPSAATRQTASAQEASPITPQSTAPQGAQAQATETCHWLGPYPSLSKAQTTQKTLGTSIGQVKPMKRPTEVENGYLILYPAAAGLPEAQANQKMLQEKGFEDAWLVDNGENRYAVSLAAVNNKQRADEALARYRTQGIPVELKPRKVLADRWWLEIKGDIDPDSLEALANPAITGPARVTVKDCD